MIVGLSLAHLLKGVSGIVQHPKRSRVYWVHLVWVSFLFLYLIHFWWWEFYLARIQGWAFSLYFLVAIYAVLLYLLCTLFFPEQLGEYDGFRGYYYSRRMWIFAVMAALPVVDIVDALLKGPAYFNALGSLYCAHLAVAFVLSLVAIMTGRPWFHAAFAIFSLASEIALILEMDRRIG